MTWIDNPAIMTPLFFVFGACIGSFVTMLVYRLPRGESIIRRPSHCTICDHRLGIIDLIPLLSYLLVRGSCRYCKAKISFAYGWIEWLCAGIYLGLYLFSASWEYSLLYGTMLCLLLAMIVIDLAHYIIPDFIQWCLLALGAVHIHLLDLDWVAQLSGAALGLGVGLLLHYGFRVLRKKEGLGFGDVKFFAVAGLWVGMYGWVPFIFIAGVLGIVHALIWRAIHKTERFPFGPALAISLAVIVLIPEASMWFWWLYQ
ncbi:MAG: prepilin peptidase [Rickettsiales bacterium]|nr:prepilin peptidase [Rickettsiales bacterium]